MTQVDCDHCALNRFCFPQALNSEDLNRLENEAVETISYQQNDHVFDTGESFKKIYTVKSGAFSTSMIDSQGVEHITGFHLPGEIFGLDAIYSGEYVTSAKALVSPSMLCSFEYDSLIELAGSIPSLNHYILRVMSKDIHSSHLKVSELTAEQKVAGFLLNLSARNEQIGYSPTQLQLVMQRKDIANFLAMAPETLSRIFKRFVKEKIISIHQTTVTIENVDQLKSINGCD